MFRPAVICVGSATVDNILQTHLPLSEIKIGDKALVDQMAVHSGGGATNAGVALKLMGIRVKIIAKLGSDHAADIIIKELKHYNLQNLCRHRSKKNTDYAVLVSSQGKDRIIYVHKGASSDLTPNDYRQSDLNTGWLYLASLLGKSFTTAKAMVKDAKKKKAKILFNPSLYLAQQRKLIAPILKATDILVLNKEEAEHLHRKVPIKQLLLGIRKKGPQTVVITAGPQKIHALHQENIYTLTPPKVKIVATAGAGDAFTAGLLAGIIKHKPFPVALQLGVVNSLSVIQHLGTKNKLLTLQEAERKIKTYQLKVTKNALR